MSIRYYDSFLNNLFLSGATDAINFSSDTIKTQLVDLSTYTFSGAHKYLSSLSGLLGTPTTLASKTVGTLGAGIFSAASPISFASVSGNPAGAYAIWKDTGTAGSSPLVGLFDQVSPGFPITPTGGAILQAIDAVNGIIRIG